MNNLTTRIVANLWQPLHFFNNDIPYQPKIHMSKLIFLNILIIWHTIAKAT
jgi:hypothetical protein